MRNFFLMRLLFLFPALLKCPCLLMIVSARTFYVSTHHHLITDVNLKVEFLGNTAIRLRHFWESNARLWVDHCVISMTCSSHSTDISFEAFHRTDIFVNRELKQPRRRRWVRRQVKNEFIFYERNSQLSRSVRFVNGSKIVLELNVQWRRVIPNGNTKY